MSDAGWKVARLRDVPPGSQLPGFSRDEYVHGMKERAPHILRRWADAGARFETANRRSHAARASSAWSASA